MSLTLILTLFFIMDSIGHISSYLTMVKGLNPARQRAIIIREMLLALLVMIFFNYIGEYVLAQLKISEPTVRITSGIILFLVAIKILFPSKDSPRANLPPGEPFLIPLAIPLIAGPSLLATIMLYAHTEPSQWTMLSSIFIAWLASVIVLLSASPLRRLLSDNGLIACERMTGMILVLLAIQRFLEGVQQFVPLYCQN